MPLDTTDLQASDAPSAQIHHRPSPDESLAPHQAGTLREVAAEAAEENSRNPSVSWSADPDDQHIAAESDPSADDMALAAQEDVLAVAQNGGLSGHEADDGTLDGDADADMDDDLMDRISSSPSIDEGGSTFALPRLSSSGRPGFPSSQSATSSSPLSSPTVSDQRSSSPYLESPDHLPLSEGGREGSQSVAAQLSFVFNPRRHHHLLGELLDHAAGDDATSTETSSLPDLLEDEGLDVGADEGADALRASEDNNGDGEWGLGPRPLQSSVKAKDENDRISAEFPQDRDGGHDNDDDSGDGDELTIPYESTEDDDGDFSEISDSRFIDSGWGGECLQDTDDIDFDFVYALHTFVATVEGQANATKGDTMVLLDDSNSYWWLVRVVKDSSIGKAAIRRLLRSLDANADLVSRLPAGGAHRDAN